MSRRKKRTINNEEKFGLLGMRSELAVMLGSKALNLQGWCLQRVGLGQRREAPAPHHTQKPGPNEELKPYNFQETGSILMPLDLAIGS